MRLSRESPEVFGWLERDYEEVSEGLVIGEVYVFWGDWIVKDGDHIYAVPHVIFATVYEVSRGYEETEPPTGMGRMSGRERQERDRRERA